MSGLIPADRQNRIIDLLKERGAVRVQELSELFQVSVLTVRRDLASLESLGLLERSHGGAVLRQTMPVEPLFSQKQLRFHEEKQKIAYAASQIIEDGDMVFVNSGSTTLEVIRELLKKKITIITNNIAAAQFAENCESELILLGGKYRSQSQSVAGDFAVQSLQQVYANKAIIGVDGFSMKYGLTTPVLQEAVATRTMVERTLGQVIVVADSNKIGIVSNFKTVSVDGIDCLITDRGGREFLEHSEMEKSGIHLIIAE